MTDIFQIISHNSAMKQDSTNTYPVVNNTIYNGCTTDSFWSSNLLCLVKKRLNLVNVIRILQNQFLFYFFKLYIYWEIIFDKTLSHGHPPN
jgi:hypothetical protein